MPGSNDETIAPGHLRPVERIVLRLAGSGKTDADIAWRLRRSPGHVTRTLALARLPRQATPDKPNEPWALRPIERTVLRARESGIAESEMAARLRRSPAYVQRVGGFADYKLAQASAGEQR
jgi:DNA-binding CsgD family transcriptional regulator